MSEFQHQSNTFGTIDLGGMHGVQKALAHLGFDPGAVDGKNGPKTEHAVKAFQTACAVPSDGIVGPVTRGALKAALDHAAAKANA